MKREKKTKQQNPKWAGLTHLQERRPLLVLVHLGGQALELGGHVAHAHEDLVLAGLLGAAAQRALQLLQLGQQVGVLGGQRLRVLSREGEELGSEGFREQRGAPLLGSSASGCVSAPLLAARSHIPSL